MPVAPTIVTFRCNTAIVKAALVAVLPGLWLGIGAPSLPVILLALGTPFLIALASWRRGTDASADGLVIRALVRSRRVPWSAVSDLVSEPNGRINALLTSGGVVELPAVSPADLPMLVAVAGESSRPDETRAPLEDRPPRVVKRNDWRLAALLLSIYMVFGLTVWSVRIVRLVPTYVPWDAARVEMLPAGGWPFPFLYDSPCCSVIGALGLEDTFKPGWFLLDAAVFSVLPVVVGVIVFRLSRRRKSHVPIRTSGRAA